ncbi:MAG: extracellular solute-binding protein [Deltaproteobacteria bacterium]|nr:extracellular solute-binding protein [Deltaproteobacteria bacterium]MBW1963184.1 extracellular solute-binding protein [Deltaproteobacteria bacterium]MBW1994221.1 extracellular solute-binding protein [Deltaproteobacteria bacterium]MBW2151198.1 extracellular solute-binding protein [Deltaproteobacteria bacterium]
MRKVTVIGLVLLLALVFAFPVDVSAKVNWRRFEGESINAIFFTAAYIDAWFRPMAKRFKKETGVTIKMEVLQAGQMRKKQDIMLAGKDENLDLIMLQMDNRGGKLTAAGHLENLEPYLADPNQTPANHGYPQDWLGG